MGDDATKALLYEELYESGEISQETYERRMRSLNVFPGTQVSNSKIAIVGDHGTVENLHFHYEDRGLSEALNHYLRGLRDRANQLPLGKISRGRSGAAPGRQMQLMTSDVYVELDTTTPGHSTCEEEVRQSLQNLNEKKRISVHGMLGQKDRLVLLGDPGAGKTTFVNYLSHVLASAHLEDGDGADEILREHLGWELGRYRPIRIILRRFGEWFPNCPHPEESIEFWLKQSLEDKGLDQLVPRFLSDLKDPEETLMIIFDGLDEVPETVRREVVAAISDFTGGKDGNRYLVTCRIYAYADPEFHLPGFEAAIIAPLSKDQIHKFIDTWYGALGGQNELKDAPQDFKDAIEHQGLFELAENPLTLTTMALLHTSDGHLPEDRIELYASTVDLLLHRWKGGGKETDSLLKKLDIPGLRMSDLQAGLNEVFFQVHQEQGDRKGRSDIPGTFIVDILKKYLQGSRDRAQHFLDYIRERSGLLIRHKADQYTYPHRIFQEYMAACHLVSLKEYPSSVARLVREDADLWRKIFPLAAGEARRSKQLGNAVLTVSALCPQAVRDKSDSEKRDFEYAIIAGEALHEIGLAAVIREDFVILERIRGWLKEGLSTQGGLPPNLRCEAGNVLSKIGDDRFDPAAFYLPGDDLGFVHIPAGEFVMGSDKDRDPDAQENERPHRVILSEYWMGKYPVTVEQYGAYLKDVGQKPDDRWKEYNWVGNHPVVVVSWEEAWAYCEWLTKKLWEGPGFLGRILGTENLKLEVVLPTEAQWEYAARGEDEPIYPWGDELTPDHANTGEASIGGISPVGGFPRGISALGLEEMGGNVWEWCRDHCDVDTKTDTYVDDIPDPLCARGSYRVVRGGAWYFPSYFCRAVSRRGSHPAVRFDYVGFRLALQVKQAG